MKLSKHDIWYDLTEVHPNEMNLLISAFNAVYKMLSETRMDTITDNQEKKRIIIGMENILSVLPEVQGSKTAESRDETIIRKVLEKWNTL